MIELKAHVLKVQRLENAAAERVGMKLCLLDEGRLLGKQGMAYANNLVEEILRDIAKEIGDAAGLGIKLAGSMKVRRG